MYSLLYFFLHDREAKTQLTPVFILFIYYKHELGFHVEETLLFSVTGRTTLATSMKQLICEV